MTSLSRALISTAGLAAALTIASPASAQPYPYGNQNTGIVGAIINSVTGGGYRQYPQGAYGYGQYPQGNYDYGQSQRAAVGMCAAAAEHRITGNYRGQPGYGYNNGYAYNGYQQGYGYNGQGARVLGITNVERRNNGSLKVSGVASSGRGYGYNDQNAYANQAGDLRFTCRVNTRGQVTDVNINRNQVAYRGY